MRLEAVIHKFREDLLTLGSRLQGHIHPFKGQRLHESGAVEPPAAETLRGFHLIAKWSAIVAIVVGYHVLVGWLFDISILKSPGRGYSTMKLGEAICSIVAGVALYVVLSPQRFSASRRAILWVCSAVAVVVPLLALFGHAFGVSLGFDHLLTPSWGQEGDPAAGPAGRIALLSTLAFLMTGLSLVCLNLRRGEGSSEALALISGAVSLLAIASYLYEARQFQGQMPLYTAVVIFLLSAGVLAARADRGLLAKVSSNSFGGLMARRLLPATLVIPILLGWLQHRGQKAGLFSSEPGMALFAIGNVLLFLFVIWWGVNSLHRMDSKRRQAEQQLQQTAAKLARSNADLEQFAYVTSHDLKEPLRAISGSVQVLQERYRDHLDPGAEEVIRHTVDGANRMQTLIDDLLTYSRLTTREAPLTPVNTEEVVEEALSNLELSLKESRAIVTRDVLPVLRADRTQMLQVFQNLISNAIKYRSQRTPKIHIGLEDRPQSGEWLFSVRDNGIGIAPQYADRIFRIFQRLHTRKEYSGTGIGLAVCKKIIERHGGRIWVESELEEGSTFYFTLPKSA